MVETLLTTPRRRLAEMKLMEVEPYLQTKSKCDRSTLKVLEAEAKPQ